MLHWHPCNTLYQQYDPLILAVTATESLSLLTVAGCTEETLKQVLYPLQLACASNMQVRDRLAFQST
jgi:hypothetical protein